jgi:menaquinone-dependent protoporphyrinogen oxidase
MMTEKILVTYATLHGSTAEVAEAIAAQLRSRGLAADVMPVTEAAGMNGALAEYDAVVLGSAIRMGQWLAPARKFVEQHATTLQQKPLALFTVHMLNREENEAAETQRDAYVAPLHALVTPQHEAFFGGRIEFRRFNLFEKLIAKVVKPVEGDARDWDAIRTWADGLFVAEPAATVESPAL